MPKLNVCVYCGSSAGKDPAFAHAAASLGKIFAENNVGLVYGGGRIGLMGICARTVMAGGGHVTGIIPDFLQTAEIAFEGISDLQIVSSMHERKQRMFEQSDAFLALPGGIGTLEETIEMLTWAQLGRHKHPILLLNTKGFWDPLITLFDHMIKSEFVSPTIRKQYSVVDDVEQVLPTIEAAL
jgi:uncharacterized protein (TIGR00730 family)